VKDYDVVVIGGGAGGLVAAREANRRGGSTLLVQDGRVGGDCTFTGCVPSKALLAAAAGGRSFGEAMTAVRNAVERVAATEDAGALGKEGIDVIDGYARVRDPRTVVVEERPIRTSHLVVATGAGALVPPIPGLAELDPLTNETVFQLRTAPASLAVLGGGPIGCELAQAFARLGVEVTVFEADDRLVPKEEPEASAVVAEALAADGVVIRTGGAVTRVEAAPGGGAVVHAEGGEAVSVAAVLAAIGRAPAGRGFGLEEIGVEVTDRGAVVVDDTMATAVDGVWAVGDVVGRAQFTHAAARMGWVAAANALSKVAKVRAFRFDERVLPWATFTAPEVGRVGLTEAEAARAHPGTRVAHLPLTMVDRAMAVGEERGFVKLLAAPRRALRHLGGGRLVGATVVAPTGGELVHEAALAMQTNMFVGRLAQTIHAYPTWSMAVQQAALQFFDSSSELRSRPARTDHEGPARP
jgi:pyruvate/2-oxoglutarate dehydrogenase complex dihydrolipoamide dehydrogenase (E3) component